MTPLPRRIGVCLIAATLRAGTASAQVASPPRFTTEVPIGDVVHVTDTAGMTVKGKLSAITPDVLKVQVGSAVRDIAMANVRQVQWRRRDSVLNGLVIGAAIGAIPGIYWLIADPNECTGLCPEDYASIAVGAGVGALIDRAIGRTVTVYSASANRAQRLTVGPVVSRTRKGVQLTVIF